MTCKLTFFQSIFFRSRFDEQNMIRADCVSSKWNASGEIVAVGSCKYQRNPLRWLIILWSLFVLGWWTNFIVGKYCLSNTSSLVHVKQLNLHKKWNSSVIDYYRYSNEKNCRREIRRCQCRHFHLLCIFIRAQNCCKLRAFSSFLRGNSSCGLTFISPFHNNFNSRVDTFCAVRKRSAQVKLIIKKLFNVFLADHFRRCKTCVPNNVPKSIFAQLNWFNKLNPSYKFT